MVPVSKDLTNRIEHQAPWAMVRVTPEASKHCTQPDGFLGQVEAIKPRSMVRIKVLQVEGPRQRMQLFGGEVGVMVKQD